MKYLLKKTYEKPCLYSKNNVIIDILNSIINNMQLGYMRISYPDLKIISINNQTFDNVKGTYNNIDTIDFM